MAGHARHTSTRSRWKSVMNNRQGFNMFDTSSRELMARVRAGDSRALDALVRRYIPVARQWARRLLPLWARQLNDASDIAQEALLKTLRRLDGIDPRGPGVLRTYLKKAVHNRIRDELRSIGRRPQIAALDPDFPSTADSPLDVTLQRAREAEQDRKYKQALATLTESERDLVVARLELGCTYEQLALLRDGWTAGAARAAVRRAVGKLAQRMARA
jgi:RNA polymerase sigma-70 factor (ECF subfamily)